MSDEVVVKVHSYGQGRALSLVYFDPISGKKKAKSAGTTDWREAERLAGELEKELRAGRYAPPSKITWKQFRERYEAERLPTLAARTRETILESFRLMEETLNPDRLCKLTAPVLSRFQAELRKPRVVARKGKDVTKPGMKETTLSHHLRNIKAALRWAVRQGMMPVCPTIDMPKTPKGQSLMKGRPITAEEFDRMLAAVPKIRPQDGPAWSRFLTGLWFSGLRLSEACELSWEEDAPFAVDLSSRRPVFRIYAAAQKARRDELLPMTPDFARWLLDTFPEPQRRGRVFRLTTTRDNLPFVTRKVGQVVSRIGERAGIIVNKAEGKYASAHDLRRAFGTRWAKRVMPAVLQRLMRHADIGTTMKYYVATTADDVADDLWAKFPATTDNTPGAGNTSGNILPESAETAGGRLSQPVTFQVNAD